MIEHLPSANELIGRAPGDWAASPPRPVGSVQDAPSPQDPPRRRWPRLRWRWVKRGLQAAAALFVVLFAWLALTAPLSKSLEPLAPPRITLLAADGTPFAQNGAVIDKPVVVADLPDYVPNAFIAIEDRRFRSHWGVDPRGLARAAWNNLLGRSTQGGSTITQQLAKMSFLTPERNVSRKARELLIAFWLEAWLSKDEILKRYLSNAYFGDNVYGLRAASLHYFNRQPERLTLAQATMLAGLVQAPSRLAPTKNLKGARERARIVLAAMGDVGFVSTEQVAATRPASLNVRPDSTLPTGTYFADWALPQARAAAEASYGDIRVKTTLDAKLQRLARRVVANTVFGKAQVALVAMRPNGEVVAMVGGRSYDASPFNRATQARRQPGSTFKLFVYTAALRAGMTPDSVIDDSPIVDGGYRPKNSSEKYRGQITLRQAFARSSNVAAVRLYRQVGGEAVLRAARDLGIRSDLKVDPALALGASGVTLLELTSAYAGVAANRFPATPHAIETEQGGLFARLLGREMSFSADMHAQLLDLLKTVVTDGTGRGAGLAIDAYGKTGTSQDNRDALFIGFAGDLVVGVWVGNDDNTPLKGVHGGGLPARIWRDFMSGAVAGARPVAPPKAEPVVEEPPLDLNISFGNDMDVQLGDNASVTLKGNGGSLKIDGQGVSVTPAPPPAQPAPEPAPAR